MPTIWQNEHRMSISSSTIKATLVALGLTVCVGITGVNAAEQGVTPAPEKEKEESSGGSATIQIGSTPNGAAKVTVTSGGNSESWVVETEDGAKKKLIEVNAEVKKGEVKKGEVKVVEPKKK
jgi:hypothetical protein